MCGIAGFSQNSNNSNKILRKMISSINHRGPDDNGLWVSNSEKVVLGHARLSIQDLSSAGAQPMQSSCGRFIIVFNGEIYNHFSLRKELLKLKLNINWRGHSDTETLVECFRVFGIKETLCMLEGMFSFAVFDKKLKRLTLARDRLGEKPLYWGWAGNTFLFTSELKSLKHHPNFLPVINRNALNFFIRHCYVPSPLSIYEGIYKLMPGHMLEVPFSGDVSLSKSAKSTPYWSIDNVIHEGISNPYEGSSSEAINDLELLLKKSISSQLLSDVKVGAFLSGGIDSSLVASIMQEESSKPIQTFTIGFDEAGYNEAEYAKDVAHHLKTDHHELYVSSADAMNVIPMLSNIFCEPFGDSSQIPTFLVSQMTKKHVTVALSGDGGDELFGGYNRHLSVEKVWKRIQKMPKPVRNLAVKSLNIITPAQWDNIFLYINPILPKKHKVNIAGEKVRKLSEILLLDKHYDFYSQLTSHWNNPEEVIIGSNISNEEFSMSKIWEDLDCLEHSMMAMDVKTYLSDDILTKVDRAAMANSLETRVPMLDHRVVELAWRMPINFKINNGQGKWILRQILYKRVPRKLIERPKAGFGIPLGEWLRGPLKDWASDLLDTQRMRNEGYFNPEPIQEKWIEHLAQRKNWQYHLWNILMFQAWLREQ